MVPSSAAAVSTRRRLRSRADSGRLTPPSSGQPAAGVLSPRGARCFLPSCSVVRCIVLSRARLVFDRVAHVQHVPRDPLSALWLLLVSSGPRVRSSPHPSGDPDHEPAPDDSRSKPFPRTSALHGHSPLRILAARLDPRLCLLLPLRCLAGFLPPGVSLRTHAGPSGVRPRASSSLASRARRPVRGSFVAIAP